MIPNFLLTRVYGLENLSGSESARIYAFNHNNSLEALMVPVLLIYLLGGRIISFVIDWMYGKIPILGSVINMTDPVYVYHKRSTLPWIEARRPSHVASDTVEQCSERLLAGRSIGIFPEGKRNRNPGYLVRGKPGIGHIALHSGVALVPVGIDFNCRITKGKIPLIGRTIVRIGRPMHFPYHTAAYLALIADRSYQSNKQSELHRMAADVTHEIMLSLAELSGKRYGESCPVKSIIFSETTIETKEQTCQV